MRISKFSQEQKLKIISESEKQGMTVQDVCHRYDITVGTFYRWKKTISPTTTESQQEKNKSAISNESIEINTLKKLYISLSAHNYELAQFLNNQL